MKNQLRVWFSIVLFGILLVLLVLSRIGYKQFVFSSRCFPERVDSEPCQWSATAGVRYNGPLSQNSSKKMDIYIHRQEEKVFFESWKLVCGSVQPKVTWIDGSTVTFDFFDCLATPGTTPQSIGEIVVLIDTNTASCHVSSMDGKIFSRR